MNKKLIAWSASFGFLAVLLGALGAHALQDKLEPSSLASFETAVRYQMWHALALMGLGFLGGQLKFLRAISFCWITGVLLFSGSIYFLSTKVLTGWDLTFLGPITPLGGLFFMAGWLLLLSSIFTQTSPK